MKNIKCLFLSVTLLLSIGHTKTVGLDKETAVLALVGGVTVYSGFVGLTELVPNKFNGFRKVADQNNLKEKRWAQKATIVGASGLVALVTRREDAAAAFVGSALGAAASQNLVNTLIGSGIGGGVTALAKSRGWIGQLGIPGMTK